jgi:hypothetical protein
MFVYDVFLSNSSKDKILYILFPNALIGIVCCVAGRMGYPARRFDPCKYSGKPGKVPYTSNVYVLAYFE